MKGETCIGPDCDREQMARFDVCDIHRQHQKAGRPLKPIEHQGQQQPACRFEGCDRPQNVRSDLCDAHKQQERLSGVLKPLRHRYGPDDTCGYEPCDKRPVTNGFCPTHDWQLKHHGEQWPIGERKREVKKKTGYSDTMTCNTCGKTKNWKLFVMGIASEPKKECKACYHLRVVSPPVQEERPVVSNEELLKSIFGDRQ